MKTIHFAAGLACLAFGAGAARAQLLNELYVSHTGTDVNEFVELIGAPGTSLTGYMVLVVEGDSGAVQGTLDKAFDLTGTTIPASGFFVLGDSAVTPNDFNIGTSDSIENGTETIYLFFTTSPATVSALVGTHVETAPAATTTILPTLGTIIDSVGLVDTGYPGTDIVYDGALVCGPDSGMFFPAGALRCGDAPSPISTGILVDFDAVPNAGFAQPTAGASNTTCIGQALPFCEPGVAGVGACQCGNPNGIGEGCSNTGATGATLSAGGTPQISADSIVLTGNSMNSGSSCIFLQGNALASGGLPFGAGIRCAGGSLKRLFIKPISGGSAIAPDASVPDPSITSRSAALGDVIPNGGTRYYQVYYRDPNLPNPGGTCPAAATFNISSGQKIAWAP